MLKMIKMELYRFFHSMSIWIALGLDVGLAFLSVILLHIMANNNASVPVYSNAGALLAAQINGGILMVLCAVSSIMFLNAKYKGGFIKNITNRLPRRELLIFPDVILMAVVCVLHFVVYSICIIGAWEIFWGNAFHLFSVLTMMKLLSIQFILHWSFCCFLLLIYMLTGNAAFVTAVGILTSFKCLNILYELAGHFIDFNLRQYMLDYNIFQTGLESTKLMYTRAAVIGLAFLLTEIMLSCLIMSKKDIK